MKVKGLTLKVAVNIGSLEECNNSSDTNLKDFGFEVAEQIEEIIIEPEEIGETVKQICNLAQDAIRAKLQKEEIRLERDRINSTKKEA